MSEGFYQLDYAIAQASGFDLHSKFDEPKAAKLLGISQSTIRRLRQSGSLEFIQVGTRRIAYFGFHLTAYLLKQQTCHEPTLKADIKLETTGSHKRATHVLGTEHGLIGIPSKQDELVSARRTLRKPKSV